MDVQIKILLGDITTSDTEAIVNAANTNLLAGSGVCGAIFKAAGYEELQAECNKLSPSKTGDAVVTGVTVGTSGSALTGLGTPSTTSVLTGVKVTAQPTIALATGATAGTGVISVATGISSASATQPSITVGTNDKVTAVTGIGTGTAAAQTITVGTNDKVTVLKSTTDVSVTKGNA